MWYSINECCVCCRIIPARYYNLIAININVHNYKISWFLATNTVPAFRSRYVWKLQPHMIGLSATNQIALAVLLHTLCHNWNDSIIKQIKWIVEQYLWVIMVVIYHIFLWWLFIMKYFYPARILIDKVIISHVCCVKHTQEQHKSILRGQ